MLYHIVSVKGIDILSPHAIQLIIRTVHGCHHLGKCLTFGCIKSGSHIEIRLAS